MPIVQVNVTQSVGSAPNQLQRAGVLISVGGTTLADNASSLLTQASDLTALLPNPVAITSATESGTTVTVTTTAVHGFINGDLVTVTGFSTTGYNGTFLITVGTTTTFTYTAAASLVTPAVGTGVCTNADVAELIQMVDTFFGQGTSLAVYVLELGQGAVTAQIAALAAYLTANPLKYYRYLVPREWDGQATYLTLVSQYMTTTSKVYFHTNTTSGNYTQYTPTVGGKAVFTMIEAPNLPNLEFTGASAFWNALNYNPSQANQVTPFCYSFVLDVTPYPATGAQQASFKAGNLNYVTTGAEGGISNAMLVNGTMCDGNSLNYWYSVDWMQINVDQALSAAIINGSNNPLAPLYYDQQGINTLLNKAAGQATLAVSNGLAVGPVITYNLTAAAFAALLQSGNAPIGVLINAVPFASYVSLFPNNYPLGLYTGLSMSYTPARGFQNIVFNINVSNFLPGS